MSDFFALLSVAFMVGFLAQTHCVGMCGPVIGILGINNSYKRIPAAILYNLGRISTYTFLGLLGGLLATQVSDITGVQYVIRWTAGAIMIFIGLQLLGMPQFLAVVEKPFQVIWKPLQKFAQRFFPIKTAFGTYIVGFIWGFLPCGAVYGPLAVAMGTGSVTTSAAIMFAFGLGTLPMMIGLAIFGNYIGRFFAKRSVRTVAGLIILAMAIYYLATIAPRDKIEMKAKKVNQETEQIRSGQKSTKDALKGLSEMGHGHGHGHHGGREMMMPKEGEMNHSMMDEAPQHHSEEDAPKEMMHH